MDPLDLRPTTTAMARLLGQIDDRQLGGPTPCPAYDVADLAEHVVGLTAAFTYAARKEPPPAELMRDGDGEALVEGWRTSVVADLDALADAWADPAAHEGTTMAGPVEMPAREAALVVLDELVVHGWDLARATGYDWRPEPTAVAGCAAFVAAFDFPADGSSDDSADDGADPDGGGGLFGPPVEVPDDSTPLDRLVAMTGRDPRWRPESHG